MPHGTECEVYLIYKVNDVLFTTNSRLINMRKWGLVMNEITGGHITNSDFYGTHIDIEYVAFNIDIENHHIIINFTNQSISIKDNKKKLKYLFLKDSTGTNITLLDCIISSYNSITFDIIFETIIIGSHINQLQSLVPLEISFEIGSSPIPLLNIHLPQEKIVLDNPNVEIQIQSCENESNNVLFIIKPINNIKLTVDDLEEIFFNILDIFFLCLGFYPYVEIENIRYNDINIKILHLQSAKYKNGNSYAHWSTIISSKSNIDLKTSYPIFKSILNRNELIIKILTNAIHSSDIIINITLSILIQCVEGYMREWHSSKKFSDKFKKAILNTIIGSLDNIDLNDKEKPTDKVINKDNIINSIKGLLGKLNEPSLGERIEEAFDTNEFTRMILKYQFENENYDDFISKSKATRNQFSHMSPNNKVFKNIFETIMAKDKYILLLRLLMLNDLKIQINEKSNLERVIGNIDNEFARYKEIRECR